MSSARRIGKNKFEDRYGRIRTRSWQNDEEWNPTVDEIEQLAAEIRSGWDERTRIKRISGDNSPWHTRSAFLPKRVRIQEYHRVLVEMGKCRDDYAPSGHFEQEPWWVQIESPDI